MQTVVHNDDLTFRESKLKEIPFADVFDRSSRTYAATFAKFGDLSYFTPVQRIGCYMDHTARLKKKHILDLIAYLKQAHKKNVNLGDESESEDERQEKMLGKADYFEHSLFLGLMPEEDPGPYQNPLILTETEQRFES